MASDMKKGQLLAGSDLLGHLNLNGCTFLIDIRSIVIYPLIVN